MVKDLFLAVWLLLIFQIFQAEFEAISPIGNGDAKGALELCLVEHAVCRSFDRRGKLLAVARQDVAACVPGKLCNSDGEVIPRADALV